MEDNPDKTLSGSGVESTPSSPVHSTTHMSTVSNASTTSLSDSTSEDDAKKDQPKSLSDSSELRASPKTSPKTTPTTSTKKSAKDKADVKSAKSDTENSSSAHVVLDMGDNADGSTDASKSKIPEPFTKLTESDVQINLRLLSDIKEGEKIMIVEGRWMKVDQRYVQSVRRWWTEDSRDRTLSFIDHVITSAKDNCNTAVGKVRRNEDKQDNMAKLLNLQSLLNGSMTGLGRMMTTYGDDKHNRATIETYVSTIRTFCDQDLKKAINSNE